MSLYSEIKTFIQLEGKKNMGLLDGENYLLEFETVKNIYDW